MRSCSRLRVQGGANESGALRSIALANPCPLSCYLNKVLSTNKGNLEKHRFFIEVIKMLIKPTGIGWKIV